MKRPILAVTALCILSSALCAQTSQRTPQSAQPTIASPEVWLITIGEGSLYWEKYGHNALWFRDPAAGVDVAFNWGLFDFFERGFVARILIGDPIYRVEGAPGPLFLDHYRASDRTIVLQRLNLTAEQARKAYEYALWNVRDENKHYRYDYFLDNCSTRVRDVIDLALGGALKAATANVRVKRTYRSETLRLVDDMKLTQFGIFAALGQPSDRPLSVWEGFFVPMRLRDVLVTLRVPRPGGAHVPLVAEERVLHESRTHAERLTNPTLWIPYLIIGLLLAAEFAAVGHVSRRSSVVEKVFRVEVTVWAFVTGVLGLVLLLAWLMTKHEFWYRNENLLLFSPLSLWLAVLVPLSMAKPRFLRPAAIVAVIVAMGAAVALILKGVPGFTQHNLPLILLLLPVHFAVAFGLWRRARVQGE